jgi:DNA-binding transcriptional LysR family regulator
VELRQLRAFLQVATSRHFGQAAAVLKITQPALTQRIQALERELGVQLLTRSAREVRLTAAGEVLLPYATSLVHIEDRALRDLADNAAGRAGRLRIAYQLQADTALMSAIMTAFRSRYPNVDVQVGSAYTLPNVEQIAAGHLDAAFVSMPIPHQDVVAARWISNDEVLLAVAERNRLARMERVPVTELAGQPMILFPSALSPILTVAFRRWLTDHIGSELNVVAEEPWEQATQGVARSDSIVAFGSSRWASAAPTPGVVYRALIPSPMTSFGIAYRRDDESRQLANLLKIVDEVVASRSSAKAPADGELISHE